MVVTIYINVHYENFPNPNFVRYKNKDSNSCVPTFPIETGDPITVTEENWYFIIK